MQCLSAYLLQLAAGWQGLCIAAWLKPQPRVAEVTCCHANVTILRCRFRASFESAQVQQIPPWSDQPVPQPGGLHTLLVPACRQGRLCDDACYLGGNGRSQRPIPQGDPANQLAWSFLCIAMRTLTAWVGLFCLSFEDITVRSIIKHGAMTVPYQHKLITLKQNALESVAEYPNGVVV